MFHDTQLGHRNKMHDADGIRSISEMQRDFNEYCLFLIFTPDYIVVKDTHTVDSTEI
jgi:hypothetical protein